MKLVFRKVLQTEVPFELELENMKFSGFLIKFDRFLVKLEAKLTGNVIIPCDLCAEDAPLIIDEKIELLLTEGVYNGDHDEFDVVEVFDEIIDLDEIMISEIEMAKTQGFSCSNCK